MLARDKRARLGGWGSVVVDRLEDVPRDRSLADPIPTEPLETLERWLGEALGLSQRDAMAMSLATVDAVGAPSQRMVMCRRYDRGLGQVVFFTDGNSPKARDLALSPRAAALFHWPELRRQVRLVGPIEETPESEVDEWFRRRPRGLQLGAWASAQSEPIATRADFLEQLARTESRFAHVERVPRPPNWRGYRLWIARCELWVGAEGRGHDRALYERPLRHSARGWEAGTWKGQRCQP